MPERAALNHHHRTMNNVMENLTVSNKEAQDIAQEPKPADKEAFVKFRKLLDGFVDETNTPASKKSHKRFLELREYLAEVKLLLNERTTKLNKANASLREARAEIADLESTISREPVKTALEIRRMVSALSGVEVDSAATAPLDTYYVDADITSVMSRFKPTYDPEAGILGIKIFVTDKYCHVVNFLELIENNEQKYGRKFDIDNNPEDALIIYQAGVRHAIAIANIYALEYGPFVFATSMVDEKNNIPSSWVTGDEEPVREEIDGDSDSDEDDDKDEGDDDDDAGPSEEELRQRLESEESEEDIVSEA